MHVHHTGAGAQVPPQPHLARTAPRHPPCSRPQPPAQRAAQLPREAAARVHRVPGPRRRQPQPLVSSVACGWPLFSLPPAPCVPCCNKRPTCSWHCLQQHAGSCCQRALSCVISQQLCTLPVPCAAAWWTRASATSLPSRSRRRNTTACSRCASMLTVLSCCCWQLGAMLQQCLLPRPCRAPLAGSLKDASPPLWPFLLPPLAGRAA